MYRKFSSFLIAVRKETVALFIELMKVMVPVMVLVRLGVEWGLIDILSRAFQPLMALVGLPPEMGVVWVTGMVVGTYGAAAAYMEFLPVVDLNVAQASIIGSMLLIAHGLPMEQSIARKAGPGFVVTCALRIGGAFVYGWLLFLIFSYGNLLQQPLDLVWLPEMNPHPGWTEWAWNSVVSLGTFFLIILGLIIVLKLMDAAGLTRMLTRWLAPFLRIMHIDSSASSLTMIGVLLGLGFGGGLIIREAQSGKLAPRTVFLSICFMGFCHSVIEDTLLMMALGSHVSAVIVGRVIFAVIAMMVLSRVVMMVPDAVFYRYLYSRSSTSVSTR